MDEVEELGRELDAAREEIESLRALNGNLLRICRERANAERGIRPKKACCGYVVKTSTEREYRYKSGGVAKKATLWETTIQTPYSVDFTAEQVNQLAQEDSESDDEKNWMNRVGIERRYEGIYEKLLVDTKCDKSQNIMFPWRLRANYAGGYWELIFSHTQALNGVPRDMRMGKVKR